MYKFSIIAVDFQTYVLPFLSYKAYKLPGTHAFSYSAGHQNVLDCDMRTISETRFLLGDPGNTRTSSAVTINVNVSTPEEDRNNSTMSDPTDKAPPSSDEA